MASAETRRSIGEQIRVERARRRWSVETAVGPADIGHMTWRKIERGDEVRAASYSGVDQAFGWRRGHTLETLEADNPGIELTAPASTPSGAEHDTTPSNAFDSILSAVEHLSIGDLRALRAVIGQRLARKEALVASIRAIRAEHDPDPPAVVREYSTATDADVSAEYHIALSEYMAARMRFLSAGSLDEGASNALSVAELERLYATARTDSESLHAALVRLTEAEKKAQRNLTKRSKKKISKGVSS